jgi:hypothetical protein
MTKKQASRDAIEREKARSRTTASGFLAQFRRKFGHLRKEGKGRKNIGKVTLKCDGVHILYTVTLKCTVHNITHCKGLFGAP